MSEFVEKIKILREKTDAPVLDCKSALEKANGDITKALEILQIKGFEKAAKKAQEEVSYSIVGTYNHNNKIGVIVELGCKTDFAAKSPEFATLLNDLCLQVCAMNPIYISREEIPQEEIEKTKQLFQKEVENKPPHIQEKIIEGKLDSVLYSKKCLLEQPFIRDEKKKVKDIISQVIARLRENIKILRFVRIEAGKK